MLRAWFEEHPRAASRSRRRNPSLIEDRDEIGTLSWMGKVYPPGETHMQSAGQTVKLNDGRMIGYDEYGASGGPVIFVPGAGHPE